MMRKILESSSDYFCFQIIVLSKTFQSFQASPQSTNTVPLSINAPAFFSPLIAITSTTTNLTDLPSFDLTLYNSLDSQHRDYGQQLFTRISQHLASLNSSTASSPSSLRAARITGMILELRSSQIQQILNSETLLRLRIDEGINLLTTNSSISPQISLNQDSTTTTRDGKSLFNYHLIYFIYVESIIYIYFNRLLF